MEAIQHITEAALAEDQQQALAAVEEAKRKLEQMQEAIQRDAEPPLLRAARKLDGHYAWLHKQLSGDAREALELLHRAVAQA